MRPAVPFSQPRSGVVCFSWCVVLPFPPFLCRHAWPCVQCLASFASARFLVGRPGRSTQARGKREREQQVRACNNGSPVSRDGCWEGEGGTEHGSLLPNVDIAILRRFLSSFSSFLFFLLFFFVFFYLRSLLSSFVLFLCCLHISP